MINYDTLRNWQKEALEKYRVMNRRDFAVTATPGAGKTTMALALAHKLLTVKQVQQIVVVAPTDHLRTQWADAAAAVGIQLDPNLPSSATQTTSDYHGYVTTYAQVAVNPAVHNKRISPLKTFVIFDEIHHAGDGLSWGEAVRQAFTNASRRLCLTGTPFRTSTTSTIPFMHYNEEENGVLISTTDYAYDYGDALKDAVVRPVTFAAYAATAAWEYSDGATGSATSDEEMDATTERLVLKAALDPTGAWIPHVFDAAHHQLMRARTTGNMPDAGGLILASDQKTATAYASIMESISQQPVTLVVSDDPKASTKIEQFKNNPDALWMVAVRMVSEGVDVPRLAVGVWATNYRTPLFFAQAVGRFVRARNPHEQAMVFIPSTKPLTALAAEMEERRKHAVAPPKEITDEEIMEDPLDEENSPLDEKLDNGISISGSEASFDHILFNGRATDGLRYETLSPEQQEYVGLPGILSPEELANLLRQHTMERQAQRVAPVSSPRTVPHHHAVSETRREIKRLVAHLSHKTGVSHPEIHVTLQRAVPGPPAAQAPLDVLERRKEWLLHKIGR